MFFPGPAAFDLFPDHESPILFDKHEAQTRCDAHRPAVVEGAHYHCGGSSEIRKRVIRADSQLTWLADPGEEARECDGSVSVATPHDPIAGVAPHVAPYDALIRIQRKRVVRPIQFTLECAGMRKSVFLIQRIGRSVNHRRS